MNLAELSPAEIDALIAPLVARGDLAEHLTRYLTWYGQLDLRPAEAGRVELGLGLASAELDRVTRELAPLVAEFERRGGWERYFTTTNKANAHVHRRTDCKTCRPGTRFEWLTAYAGEPASAVRRKVSACSTCFRRWV